MVHRPRAWAEQPAFCKKGSNHPSAKLYPVERSGRGLAMYDPETQKFTTDRHLLQHPPSAIPDAQEPLWTSSGAAAPAMATSSAGSTPTSLDATGDEAESQGWTPLVLDTNGNGKRDDYTEPNQPPIPARTSGSIAGFYGMAPSPADGSSGVRRLGFPG